MNNECTAACKNFSKVLNMNIATGCTSLTNGELKNHRRPNGKVIVATRSRPTVMFGFYYLPQVLPRKHVRLLLFFMRVREYYYMIIIIMEYCLLEVCPLIRVNCLNRCGYHQNVELKVLQLQRNKCTRPRARGIKKIKMLIEKHVICHHHCVENFEHISSLTVFFLYRKIPNKFHYSEYSQLVIVKLVA